MGNESRVSGKSRQTQSDKFKVLSKSSTLYALTQNKQSNAGGDARQPEEVYNFKKSTHRKVLATIKKGIVKARQIECIQVK